MSSKQQPTPTKRPKSQNPILPSPPKSKPAPPKLTLDEAINETVDVVLPFHIVVALNTVTVSLQSFFVEVSGVHELAEILKTLKFAQSKSYILSYSVTNLKQDQIVLDKDEFFPALQSYLVKK